MLPEHFEAIYRACDSAIDPADRPYAPADWWRALIVTGIMTGMRRDEMLTIGGRDVYPSSRFAGQAWLRAGQRTPSVR